MKRRPLSLLVLSLLSAPLAAQDFSKVEVSATPVAEGVYSIQGAGGNVGLVVGRNGAFMIDDQYAPLAPKIKAAVEGVTDQPVRFVLNTHWHGDHTGGNEAFAASGTLVVAHDNVRKRMSTDQFVAAFNRNVPASPEPALPVANWWEKTQPMP